MVVTWPLEWEHRLYLLDRAPIPLWSISPLLEARPGFTVLKGSGTGRSDFLKFMLEYCLVFPMSLQLLR